MAKASAKYDGSFGGVEILDKVLAGVSNEMRTTMLVPALKDVGLLLEEAMRFNAPERFGFLKASFTTKTVRWPQQGTAVAITGPQRAKVARPDGKGIAMPTKYAHLAEFGFTDRSGKFRPAQKPFMRPAVDFVKPMAGEIMARNLAAQIERSVKKNKA